MKLSKFLLPVIAVAVFAIYLSLFVVKEINQAIVLQFGDPKKVIVEPGLQFKIPFIQNILDEYNSGIQITQVQTQKADPPDQVIDAFRDVQAARADMERSKNEAEAYANDVIPRARGELSLIHI